MNRFLLSRSSKVMDRRHYSPLDFIPIICTITALGMFRFGPGILRSISKGSLRGFDSIRNYVREYRYQKVRLTQKRLRDDEATFNRISQIANKDIDAQRKSKLLLTEWGKISWRTRLSLPFKSVAAAFKSKK
jgi:hypothetical protein